MWEEILKAFTGVYLPSMLKFILGPLAGSLLGLNIVTTMVASLAGMMTVVSVVIYSGQLFRQRIERFFDRWLKQGKLATFFQRYGLAGVAFFTPLFLMPIGGALLSLAFLSTHSKGKILLYMLLSGSFWSIVLTSLIYFFGHNILPEIVR